MNREMSKTSRRISFFIRFALFFGAVHALGIKIVPYEFARTTARQQELYAKGRTAPGRKVTFCDGIIKLSNHQHFLAIDACLVIDDVWIWRRHPLYERLGRIAAVFGLKWGGDWDADETIDSTDFDIYHFELG